MNLKLTATPKTLMQSEDYRRSYSQEDPAELELFKSDESSEKGTDGNLSLLEDGILNLMSDLRLKEEPIDIRGYDII